MINADLETGSLLFYLADFSLWCCSDNKVGSHLPSVEKPRDDAAVPVAAAVQSWPTEGAKAQQPFSSPPHPVCSSHTLRTGRFVTPYLDTRRDEKNYSSPELVPQRKTGSRKHFVVKRASLPMSHCVYLVSCFQNADMSVTTGIFPMKPPHSSSHLPSLVTGVPSLGTHLSKITLWK